MKKYVILAIVIGLGFQSCKEKNDNPQPGQPANTDSTNTAQDHLYLLNTPDTLIADYLPAYPGSFWEYQDGNGTILRDRTDSSYVLSKNHQDRNNYPNLPKGSAKDPYIAHYVPYFRSELLGKEDPLWNYGFYENDYIRGITSDIKQEYYTILEPSNEVGKWWMADSYSNTAGHIFSEIFVKDTVLEVNNTLYTDVIGVQESMRGYTRIPNFNLYFAKDVGIILKEELDSASGAITKSWYLTRYFINK